MTGDTHYNLEVLAELAEGLLDDATARQVREHLAICDPCGERLADLAAVREVLAAIPVPAMPMGVALRVDRALAAEAERGHSAHNGAARNGALKLDEAPDWDRIMRDAPWETESPVKEPPLKGTPAEMPAATPAWGMALDDAPAAGIFRDSTEAAAMGPLPEHSPAEAGAPALGVVLGDGSVAPRRTSRRRRWIGPISAVAAAAAVVGGTVVTANVLTAPDGRGDPKVLAGPPVASASPSKVHKSAATEAYPVGDSGYFYADAELKGPLVGYFGPQPGAGGMASADPKLDRCIRKVSKLVGSTPIGVDRAYYNGSEAAIMVFRHDKTPNSVQVRVLSSNCKNLRKPGLARWN